MLTLFWIVWTTSCVLLKWTRCCCIVLEDVPTLCIFHVSSSSSSLNYLERYLDVCTQWSWTVAETKTLLIQIHIYRCELQQLLSTSSSWDQNKPRRIRDTNLQLPLEGLHLALQLTEDVGRLPHVFHHFALQVMQPEDGDGTRQWVLQTLYKHHLYRTHSPALHAVQLCRHPHTCTWTNTQPRFTIVEDLRFSKRWWRSVSLQSELCSPHSLDPTPPPPAGSTSPGCWPPAGGRCSARRRWCCTSSGCVEARPPPPPGTDLSDGEFRTRQDSETIHDERKSIETQFRSELQLLLVESECFLFSFLLHDMFWVRFGSDTSPERPSGPAQFVERSVYKWKNVPQNKEFNTPPSQNIKTSRASDSSENVSAGLDSAGDRTTPADDWMRRTSCLVAVTMLYSSSVHVWLCRGRWWEQRWCRELVQMFLHWQFGLRSLNQSVCFLSSLKVEGFAVTWFIVAVARRQQRP